MVCSERGQLSAVKYFFCSFVTDGIKARITAAFAKSYRNTQAQMRHQVHNDWVLPELHAL
jgi:hypothetical protein